MLCLKPSLAFGYTPCVLSHGSERWWIGVFSVSPAGKVFSNVKTTLAGNYIETNLSVYSHWKRAREEVFVQVARE